MKLTNTDQALQAVIEIALKETGKAKAADAIRANAQRIETQTEVYNCALYKTENGTPVFKATAIAGGNDIHLSGYKLLQKATSLENNNGGFHGNGNAGGGLRQGKTDSAERNRAVGLMRRKSG